MLRPITWLPTLTLVALAWSADARPSTTPDSPALDFIEPLVERVMNEWQAPGAVVVVISEGELVYSRGFGVAHQDTREPVDVEQTAFRLASISKPVTAFAAMRLHQQGHLDLHADLHRYLQPFRVEGPGILTAAHLLTHTGGFEDRFLTRFCRDPERLPYLQTFLGEQMPPRRYPAGEISLYSNYGIALLGLVIEEITQNPFPKAIEKLVFDPLGMSSSSFELRPGQSKLAQGYRFGESVPPHGIKTIPASMLVSTGADMARWMKALVEPGESSVLDPQTVDLMLTRHFGYHPSLTGRAFGFAEDSSVSPRRLFHSGSLDGFSSGIVLVPESAGAVLVALNGNANVWEIIREILQRLMPADPAPSNRPGLHPPRVLPDPPETASGRFVPADIPRESFDKARLLFEQVPIQIAADGVLTHSNRLYRPGGEGVYRDESGRIALLHRGEAGDWFLLEEHAAWVRLPWHAYWLIHAAALLLLAGALTLQVAGRPLILRGWPDGTGNAVVRCFRLAAGLDLFFLVGVGGLMTAAMSQNGGLLRFQIPWYLAGLLTLPLLALGLTLVAILLEVRRTRKGDRRDLTPSLLTGLTVCAFSCFLSYWRLLGFHF